MERRHPLRFVWHMDADGRFVVGSDEFIELVGPRTMATVGRLWSEIAGELNLDPDNQVTRAIATHETWSGIVVSWPVDNSNERLPVELSGLPVFDRDRSFRGYRGFGVCRDVDRINELARERRERPIDSLAEVPQQNIAAIAAPPVTAAPETIENAAPANAPEPAEAAAPPDRPAISVTPGSANVVPFRQSQPAEPKTPPHAEPGRTPSVPRTGAGTHRALARTRAGQRGKRRRGRAGRSDRSRARRRRRPRLQFSNRRCSTVFRSASSSIGTTRCSTPIGIFWNGAVMRASMRSKSQAA